MNMLLHHQKRRNLIDGTSINIGEDGCPFADNELLIVADGLGGRGGYPHTKIDPDILNHEVFYNKFIQPVVGDANEGYVRFVMHSFRELFELGERYFTSSATMRTSGYFASRLVTAIVLHALKFDPDLRREVIFENIMNKEGEAQKQYIDWVREEIANRIQQQLFEIASLMGLELESKTKGSYLLPTTLTVTLINETERGLDVLYLWAGDSRGYLWNADGLAQITDDHERDETMTNLITLTKPFQLEARLFKTNKPAILFNSTDGCYKCPCFASPFDLEYVFLQAIDSSRDFEETSRNLDEQFAVIGTHDDSNTMALKAFGYESFEAVKKAVSERLDYLHEHYIKELPGILERDYQDELNQIEEQMEGGIFAVKDDLIEIESIVDIVKKKMVDERYAPYIQEENSLKKKLDELNESEVQQKTDVLRWVQYYWLREPYFKKYSTVKDRFSLGHSYAKFVELETACRNEQQRHAERCATYLENLKKCFSAVVEMRDNLLDIQSLRENNTREDISQRLKAMRMVLVDIGSCVDNKFEKVFSRYSKDTEALNSYISHYAKTDEKAIIDFADQICNGAFDISNVEMTKECRCEIDTYLDGLKFVAESRHRILDEVSGLQDKHFMGYWAAMSHNLVMFIYNNHYDSLPADIQARIAQNAGELQAKRDEIAHCLEIRNKLYDIYADNYNRYFEESAL